MPRHEPLHQLSSRVLGVESILRVPGHGLVDEHVGVLGASHRAGADHGSQLSEQQQVGDVLTTGGEAGLAEGRGDLAPHPRCGARQHCLEHLQGPGRRRVVETEAPVPRPHRRLDLRGGDPLDPPQVLRRDEVPRRPQDVGSQPAPRGLLGEHPGVRVPAGIRIASDQAASGASWACTQVSSRTTSAPWRNPRAESRWVASRRRWTRSRELPLIRPSSHPPPTRAGEQVCLRSLLCSDVIV